MPELETLIGTVYREQDATVFIGRYQSFTGMIWGGKCARLEEGTVDEGKIAVHTRQAANGGLERDPNVREGMPGEATGTLVLKLIQGNRMRSTLRKCFWIFDKRYHCEGKERPAWDAWETIVRSCPANVDSRAISGSSFDDADAESLVTFPFTALDEIDLWRVAAEYGEIQFFGGGGLQASINDLSVCQGASCSSRCDTQEDCVAVAVTEPDSVYSDPWLLVNLSGGELPDWTGIQLTEWTTGADAVHCNGKFLIIVSEGETAILRSDDRGVTRVEIDETDVTSWASHAPLDVDFMDQTYILIVGKDGWVWVSRDAARTIEISDRGRATTEDLTQVMIARDNPQVAYAIGANNAVIKTENGARLWYPVTGPSPTDALLAMLVISQTDVLFVNDDGEIWGTEDGGQTYTELEGPPGMKGLTLTEASLAGCGCGVVYLTATDGTNHFAYRNVENGASGKWSDIPGEDPPDDPHKVACCGPNRAIVVGGDGTTSETIGLIS